jgi:hypothetical protein
MSENGIIDLDFDAAGSDSFLPGAFVEALSAPAASSRAEEPRRKNGDEREGRIPRIYCAKPTSPIPKLDQIHRRIWGAARRLRALGG